MASTIKTSDSTNKKMTKARTNQIASDATGVTDNAKQGTQLTTE